MYQVDSVSPNPQGTKQIKTTIYTNEMPSNLYKGNGALLLPRPRPQLRLVGCGQFYMEDARTTRKQSMRPASRSRHFFSYDQVPVNQVLRPNLVRSRIGQRAPWTGNMRPNDIHRATELRQIDCWPHRLATHLDVVTAATTSCWSWPWP
jgi:hypothetical protein